MKANTHSVASTAVAPTFSRREPELAHWLREARLLVKDRVTVSALALLLVLSTMACVIGLIKVDAQKHEIEAMIAVDAADRAEAQAGVSSYGDAAYYSFYVTWDAPAPLAFAAFGQRDTAPYLKRVRMLAIEGQIYQGESPNPLLAKIGSLDLAYVAAYVLPLVLIILLHDMKASERAAGRLNLLEASPLAWRHLWLPRITLRSGLALLALVIPFITGAIIQHANAAEIISGVFGMLLLTLFWTAISALIAHLQWRASTLGAVLIGVWLVLNVLVPAAVQSVWLPQVEGPEGADVALVQREAVNDAWDLPKAATLEPFFALFPQYRIEGELNPFDWRWYFAFQHMGDVAAKDLSEQYLDSIASRDVIAAKASWLSPALAIQRHLQSLGKTDTAAQLSYDAAIRQYHAELRGFYYPLVFGGEPFERDALAAYPKFGTLD